MLPEDVELVDRIVLGLFILKILDNDIRECLWQNPIKTHQTSNNLFCIDFLVEDLPQISDNLSAVFIASISVLRFLRGLQKV